MTDKQVDEIDDLFNQNGSDWGDNEEGVFTFLLNGWDEVKELADILRKDERISDEDLSDEEVIEKFGEYEFKDEYFKEWDGDGKIHPFYRNYLKAYANFNGELYSDKTILADKDLQADYIETLVNSPKEADTFLSEKEFTENGFTKLNDEKYQNGFYGQTDDPAKILKDILEKDKDAKVVFSMNSYNPWATDFDVYVKKDNLKESRKISRSVKKRLKDDLLVEEFDTKEKKKALANYFGVMQNSFKNDSYDTNLFSNRENGEEYLVLTEDEALEYAKEDVENTFDDMGLESFTPEFQEWIKDNALDKDWFESAMEESNLNYLFDIESEDDDVFENRLISELVDEGILTEDDFDDWGEEHPTVKDDVDIDEKKEEYVEVLSDQDPIEWYLTDFGERELSMVIRENPSIIDMDAIVNECINLDGVAHFVARYDGEEVDLGNGLFAYRVA